MKTKYGNGLMSVEELELKYQITNTCMFYNSLLSCLLRLWKHLIQNNGGGGGGSRVSPEETCSLELKM